MTTTIQSVHFVASEQLEQFVEQKVGKLDQFFDGIIKASVILRVEKSDSTENKVAEISIDIPGSDLFAKKQAKSFEEAVDLSTDALRKQLIKRKEKVREK